MILDRFLTTIKLFTALAIVGTLFYAGCSSTSNITHEVSGVVIPQVSPYTIKQTSSETTESEIVKVGKFSDLTVNFSNLNAIPFTVTKYKVEYIDNYTGEKLSDLTIGVDTTFTVQGTASVASTSNSTTSSGTSTGTSSTTGTTTASTTASSSSSNSFTIGIVNTKVKAALYKNVTDPLDNIMLNVKLTFYGNDYNGNGMELSTAVTIQP